MDPLTLGLMAGGQVASGTIGALSSYMASQNQLKAANRAKGAIDSSYRTADSYQSPYRAAGTVGLDRLMSGNFQTATPGIYQHNEMQPQYRAEAFNFEADPGYQFTKNQGMEAILNSNSARGAGLSGATQKAMMKYGTGLANQTFNDAWQRYMGGRQQNQSEYGMNLGQFNTNRAFGAGQQQQDYLNRSEQDMRRYGQATDLASIGQSAANTSASLASNYGNSLASLYGQMGNAQAAGTMGVGQGINNALGGLTSGINMYRQFAQPDPWQTSRW